MWRTEPSITVGYHKGAYHYIMMDNREEYTMGYGPAAVALMGARSAQTHAAFFLPYLKPGMTLLDCGCGPGTVTLGFAGIVAPGSAVGTDIEPSQMALATKTAVLGASEPDYIWLCQVSRLSH